MVTFPDFSFGATDGKNLDEALIEAPDCLRAIIAAHMIDKKEVPAPSRPKRGQRLVPVPLFLAPKVALYMAARRMRMTNAELARRLKVRETIVRRLLDPHHESRAESL
jgi:antitoxin HicB